MAIVKAFARYLVFLAVLYACFRYLGDFSIQQSTVLTFVGWLVYGLYERLSASRRAERMFEPFCVSILPNWYKLLSDFKLIGGKEEWHRLCEEAEKVPTSEYSVFRSGFFFTVMSPPSDGLLPGLTYWNNRNSFLSKVEFLESIINLNDDYFPTGGEEQHPFFRHPRWSGLPSVYFKPGINGFELGLEVQDDWWKHLRESGEIGELAKTKDRTDHLCGTTKLEIATLPYSEFSIYYDVPIDRLKEWEQARNKQFATTGWERKIETDSEIRDPWSRVEHKYFAIAHRGI